MCSTPYQLSKSLLKRFLRIRCLRLGALAIEVETEMFTRDQHLWSGSGWKRMGQGERNCIEAWKAPARLAGSAETSMAHLRVSWTPMKWPGLYAWLSPRYGLPQEGSAFSMQLSASETNPEGANSWGWSAVQISHSWATSPSLKRALEGELHDHHIRFSVNPVFLKGTFLGVYLLLQSGVLAFLSGEQFSLGAGKDPDFVGFRVYTIWGPLKK